MIYPDLYRVDNINLEGCLTEEDENGGELLIPQPDRLQLSFERISATGILKKFRQFDEFFKLNCNLKITRQIDLVLHYLAYECCNLTNF